MATIVKGEQYFELDGQLSEIKRQLRQLRGYPFDLQKLKYHLQEAIEGHFNDSLPDSYRDLIRQRFFLANDVMEVGGFSVAKLEPIPFSFSRQEVDSLLKISRSLWWEVGEKIRERAKELGGNFGQRHLDYLLNCQEDIPAGWRGVSLAFPGTVWVYQTLQGYDLYAYSMQYLSDHWDRVLLQFRTLCVGPWAILHYVK